VSAIPQIVAALSNAFAGNTGKIITAGVKLLVSLIASLPSIIVEVVKAVPQIVAGLVRAFTGYIGQMAQVGGNLIKGLWQGISDAGAWLWNKISGFFGGVVDRIKDFFGIHSPSTLFAGLGRNMGEGIGVGFEDAMASVSREMQNAIPTSFSVSAGVSGRSISTGTSITQNISVVSPKALSEKELAREFKNLSRKLALEY
jgi:phage-related protein